MSVGTRIMQIRSQKGMSQRVVGERAGIAGSYLSRIENRHIEPGPKTLQKIAQALEVPLGELFQERGGGLGTLQCVITSSGNCIMDLLRANRGKPPQPGVEGYTPRQVQLLRMASYLVQAGDTRLLDALEVLLGGLLNSDRNKPATHVPASSNQVQEGSSPPA